MSDCRAAPAACRKTCAPPKTLEALEQESPKALKASMPVPPRLNGHPWGLQQPRPALFILEARLCEACLQNSDHRCQQAHGPQKATFGRLLGLIRASEGHSKFRASRVSRNPPKFPSGHTTQVPCLPWHRCRSPMIHKLSLGLELRLKL